METNSTLQVISLVASIASLVLAVGAIWLSIAFFKMSSEASKSTTEAAKGIGASVERVEKLFDKLYTDTFSMMRDTVSDMRKHIWPDEDDSEPPAVAVEIEKKADEKIAEIKGSLEVQLREILDRQQKAELNTTSLRDEMRHLVDRAILASRQVEVEAREETTRAQLLRLIRVLRRTENRVTAGSLAGLMPHGSGVMAELEKLAEEGVIELSPPPPIGVFTKVRLKGVWGPLMIQDPDRRSPGPGRPQVAPKQT